MTRLGLSVFFLEKKAEDESSPLVVYLSGKLNFFLPKEAF